MKFFHKSHRQHRRNRQSIFKRERAKMKQIIIIVSLVAILMCQVATAAHLRSIQENQSTEVTTETNDDDDDELPNDLQCILDVLRSLQDFVQGQHGWFDRVMAMLRRLQDMRAACDDIELDFLQRQCRAAVDALRAVYLAIIVYDIQNIINDFPDVREEFMQCRDELSYLM